MHRVPSIFGRCTTWPLREVYNSVAAAGVLFPLIHNQSLVDPWDRPCDVHLSIATGTHHYCVLDASLALQCSGHDDFGQSSLYWQRPPPPPPKVDGEGGAGSAPGRRLQDGLGDRLQGDTEGGGAQNATFLAVCAGLRHTCAIRQQRVGNTSGVEQEMQCWGEGYSEIDTQAVNLRVVLSGFGDANNVVCGKRFVCALQPSATTASYGTVRHVSPTPW